MNLLDPVPTAKLDCYCKGMEISAILGENFPSWLIIPMNLRSSDTVLGGGISLIAAVFRGSG